MPGGKKGHTDLTQPAAKSSRFFYVRMTFTRYEVLKS